MPRAGLGLALLCVATVVGCRAAVPGSAPVEAANYGVRDDAPALARLRARADGASQDFRAQFDAGMAHLRATLDGDLHQRDAAEDYLERAWRRNPAAQPTAQILARFLNMRGAALDFSKVALQIELYESIASPERVDPRRAAHDVFTTDCFLESARAMGEYDAGRTVAAYARVARLERRLALRLRHRPDEVDSHAMAGNYELGFAAVLPRGRTRRLDRAIEHLRVQQARWDELSPGARAEWVAPNVRAVWAFMLAEALTAAGETEEASAHYRAVERLGSGAVGPGRQLAQLSGERLRHLPEYRGRAELLPVWPTGAASCIACHSSEASVPTVGLFTLESSSRREGGSR